MSAVILLGALSLGMAVAGMPVRRLDVYFPILSFLTVLVGSRVTIRIPRFKSHIAVSDTFIFLTLLLYGGEFAVIVSAVEAFFSSWRFCNRKITVFFNAATMAISTSMVYALLRVAGLYTDEQLHGQVDHLGGFAIALSLIATTQFGVNTALAAVYDSLKNALPLWDTWKSKYIWTFFSYFAGVIGAGVLVQLADSIGMLAIFAIFPVILLVYLSYKMYMKNVEISIQQAEQAEQYAKLLEIQADALRESEERFRSAFDYAPIGIGLADPGGSWLKANRALTEILGYSEDELSKTDFQSITLPEDLGRALLRVHDIISGKMATCQLEQRYIHKTGRIVWTSWSVSAASEMGSRRPNLIFQIQDITDKKLAEEKLQYEASHDALTGLPNRAFFMTRLGDALSKARELRDYKVCVLFIDLDRFKYVNDSLGHVIGDELLKSIADRLCDCMRPSDLVARLGGDEFTVLIEGQYDEGEVNNIAGRIQKKFGIPFDLKGHEVYSSASIGILHATEKHLTSEDVMRDADTAMYQAKRAGKARHEVFDERMHNAAKEILRLETDLRRALDRNEINVVYQPIYSIASGQIECFESLARWEHAELGSIAPAKFIPLAEEIGLIDELCRQVLRTACRDISQLHERRTGEVNYSVSVNLSCRQFNQKSLVQDIDRILDETSFSPRDLKLEITESVFFEHQQRAVAMLNELRERGIDINVDDFGTGYSNLGYLTQLPISALKIDRSFVSMIDEDGSNDDIVRAIITLARSLDLRVIAEGVETDTQLMVLRRLGCESAQGYLYAPAMCFEDLRQFISSLHTTGIFSSLVEDIPTGLLVQ